MSEEKTKKSVGQIIGSTLMTLVMVFVVVLAMAVAVVPRVAGAVPLTVLTGSMQPTISPGDLVVVRPVEASELAIGDVVTFQPESDNPDLITHRVIDLNYENGELVSLLTRGDANGADDPVIVPDQVMGRLMYTVPLVGRFTSGSRTLQLSTIGGVGLITYAVVMLLKKDKPETAASETNLVPAAA